MPTPGTVRQDVTIAELVAELARRGLVVPAVAPSVGAASEVVGEAQTVELVAELARRGVAVPRKDVTIYAPSAGSVASAPAPKVTAPAVKAPPRTSNGCQARPRERRGRRTRTATAASSRDGPSDPPRPAALRGGRLPQLTPPARCACGGELDRDHLAACSMFWTGELRHVRAMLWLLKGERT